jgi:hypothetical protein
MNNEMAQLYLTSVGLVNPHPHFLLYFFLALRVDVLMYREVSAPHPNPRDDGLDRRIHLRIRGKNIRYVG